MLVVTIILFHHTAIGDYMRSRGCSFSVQNLPVHHWKYAPRIKGQCKIIPNELVVWSYPFDWVGNKDDGNSVRIKPRDSFKIIKVDSKPNSSYAAIPSGYLVAKHNGEYLRIRHPPNTAQVFDFQEYDFYGMKGMVHIDSIKNRIGDPDHVTDYGPAVIYSWKTDPVPVYYSTYDTTDNSGYVEMEDSDGYIQKRKIEWTSKTPRYDAYTVEPYHFSITCDKDGYVIRVYDLIKDRGN